MQKGVKLLVCDLDGTLLNDNKQVTDNTIQVLKEARARGMKLCFASGRYEGMMSIYIDTVGGVDYNLSCNGAVARDQHTGKVIFYAAMMPHTVTSILAFLKQQEMAFMLYTMGKSYYPQNFPRLGKRLADYEALSAKIGYPTKLDYQAIDLDTPVQCQDVVKIVAYEEDDLQLNKFQQYITNLPGVHCESTGYGLLSAADQNASKKTALLAVMSVMGITERNVCVFGDYTNDLSMFACAAHRVAVANAVAEVKAQATFITSSNNDDGVAHYIKKLLE